MFSDNVTVVSRPFSKGRDDLTALIFSAGLAGRAQLRPYNSSLDGPIDDQTSTAVRIRIPIAKMYSSMHPPFSRTAPANQDQDELHKLTNSFLAQLCFALNVSVLFESREGIFTPTNSPYYAEWSNETFIKNLSQTFLNGKSLPEKLSNCVEPLTDEDGNFCGRACVAITPRPLVYVRTIDQFSLKHTRFLSRGPCEGVIEQTPTVVNRKEGDAIVTPTSWSKWASKQIEHLVAQKDKYTATELYVAASHLSNFDVDIRAIAHCRVKDKILPLSHCLNIFKKAKKLSFLVRRNSPFGNDDADSPLRLAESTNFCHEVTEELGQLKEQGIFVQSLLGIDDSVYEEVCDNLTDASAPNVLSYFLRVLNENAISYSVTPPRRMKIGRYSGFETNKIRDGEVIYGSVVTVSQTLAKRAPYRTCK